MNSRNLDFKVIHFSTGHAGGAGLAARRLSWELNNAGIFSKFYALEKTEYRPEENEYAISRTNRLKMYKGDVLLNLPVFCISITGSTYLASVIF